MYWTVNVSRSSFKDDAVSFVLDYPRKSTFEADEHAFVAVGGWCYTDGDSHEIVVFSGASEVPVQKVNRPDVTALHPEVPVDCGFKCVVPAGPAFRIGVRSKGDVRWLVDGHASVVNALIGKDDFLFLDKDHNDSLAQFRGDKRIPDDELGNWKRYFEEIARRRVKLGFKSAFLLAPGKEQVFPDFYPHSRGAVGPAEQLVSTFGGKPEFLYPIADLVAERFMSFPKTDTHWTDYGARLAARRVCEHLGVQFNDPKFRFDCIEKAGDLGRKFEPWRSETIFKADLSPALKHKVFDNEVNNRGWVRVFENQQANGVCVIFGDSFSERLVDYLSMTFRRLVHVFSAADIDWSIVEDERPDFLVSEITTRFTVEAPEVGFSILNELKRKAGPASASEKIRVMRAAGAWKTAGRYFDLTKQAFE
ncbi:hypothetical protein FHR76_002114 [Rhizobium sp. RAS22]|nr:hypothetical protein [Rhizobium sp. RAS22]